MIFDLPQTPSESPATEPAEPKKARMELHITAAMVSVQNGRQSIRLFNRIVTEEQSSDQQTWTWQQ